MISLIVARDRNGAIGRDGDIPWHVPEDLKFFQRETMGGAVIMGRNTWNSLPPVARPLKNRLNLVVSSGAPEGAEHVLPSIEAAVEAAKAAGHARIYGIGGAGIYRALLPLAQRLLITEVDLDVDGADTWFPAVEMADWSETLRVDLRSEGPKCILVEYMRRV
ncbi:dihydrofolate reductase [Roseovarius phycicola]|uniref:Dihydrofolate reductase n=1 Tax=Roseovarius phycicola TaxID=3080976 RepID=A0ABZ2HDJ3_9RHOB